MNHTICLTDKEAALAATGELKALVRVMKPQPPAGFGGISALFALNQASPWKPGDVLDCKETWTQETECGIPTGGIIYKATNAPEPDGSMCLVWHSPITMPKWPIRHHYRVTASRATVAAGTWVWYCELEAVR